MILIKQMIITMQTNIPIDKTRVDSMLSRGAESGPGIVTVQSALTQLCKQTEGPAYVMLHHTILLYICMYIYI